MFLPFCLSSHFGSQPQGEYWTFQLTHRTFHDVSDSVNTLSGCLVSGLRRRLQLVSALLLPQPDSSKPEPTPVQPTKASVADPIPQHARSPIPIKYGHSDADDGCVCRILERDRRLES
ncbi:hypothetical protein JAAARDRAFT_551908 [Jaapia argillacea MUCL 33604]|uniref:Uncharacterized protein n=1 Tax=Jaapia argillacea MUCL 33604 TaxID=933084 RepID=A0A067P9X8_9AGAM|nr:hypothetical protein JAAARDRAFT_551908 [Jaapia argillacea MUCL 33604]